MVLRTGPDGRRICPERARHYVAIGAGGVFNSSLNKDLKPEPCTMVTLLVGAVLWAALAGGPGGCPPAPTGLTLFPAHCIGPSINQEDCGSPLKTAHCNSSTAAGLRGCVAEAAAACAGASGCASFALMAGGTCGFLPRPVSRAQYSLSTDWTVV